MLLMDGAGFVLQDGGECFSVMFDCLRTLGVSIINKAENLDVISSFNLCIDVKNVVRAELCEEEVNRGVETQNIGLVKPHYIVT